MEFWSVFQGMSVPSLWTEIFYFIQMSSSLSKRRMTSLKFVEFHIILPYHFTFKKALLVEEMENWVSSYLEASGAGRALFSSLPSQALCHEEKKIRKIKSQILRLLPVYVNHKKYYYSFVFLPITCFLL